MTHTSWQAGTTIAQDFTLRRALSRGANFEPWLADGPDASASYIVHRLTPSIATSEEASRIAALRQSYLLSSMRPLRHLSMAVQAKHQCLSSALMSQR